MAEVTAEEEQQELTLGEIVQDLIFWRSLGLIKVTLVDGCSSKEERVAQNIP